MENKVAIKTREFDFVAMEKAVAAGYAVATPRYRSDDEVEVTSENHRRLSRILQEMSLSFSEPIVILDVGCGTGRYFHCLRNVSRLIGMDISADMLAAAHRPVRHEQITIPGIQLMRGNVYLTRFPPDSFHLIYSLGMFGHGCPVTVEICNRFYDWLVPGGKLFFNTIDYNGLPLRERVRRTLRHLISRSPLPGLRQKLLERDRTSTFFPMTPRELERTLAGTRFKDFAVMSTPTDTPLWTGRHLECIASKERA